MSAEGPLGSAKSSDLFCGCGKSKRHVPGRRIRRKAAVVEDSYHQRIKEEKRSAAVRAAMELFLEEGYERTSLQQVAGRADVSTATLV